MTKEQATVKKPQLVYSARQMFETRLAKYNDPRNLEWDFDDITDKWERHAWSAFLDLQSTEAERDALLSEVVQLREAADAALKAIGAPIMNPLAQEALQLLRAALAGKEKVSSDAE